jgi:hypothetical protein
MVRNWEQVFAEVGRQIKTLLALTCHLTACDRTDDTAEILSSY